jgi:hypothetical protein
VFKNSEEEEKTFHVKNFQVFKTASETSSIKHEETVLKPTFLIGQKRQLCVVRISLRICTFAVTDVFKKVA